MKLIRLAGLVWALSMGTAVAEPAGLSAESTWHQAVATIVDVDFGDSGFHARWQYYQCGCGDILIRSEQAAPDGVETGELLLIDGQVLLIRGYAGESGDLTLLLEAPTLMLQLAFALLHRAEHKGPASVTERQKSTLTEKHKDVELNTGLAVGRFSAPWRLDTSVWPSGEQQRRFDMTFRFTVPTAEGNSVESAFRFTGALDFRADSYPLHDATPLAGWRMQWMSRGETEAYAAPAELTVGELRQQVMDSADLPNE